MPNTNSIQSLCQHYLCSQHYSIHVTLVLQPNNNATNSRGQFEIPLTRQVLFLRLSQRTLYNTMAAIFHVMIMWHDNVAQPEIPISGQFLVLRIVAFRSGQRRSRCGVATLTPLTRPPVTGTCTPVHSRKMHEGLAKGVATLKVPWRHLFDVTSCGAPIYLYNAILPTCYTYHLLGNVATVVRVHCVCIQIYEVKHKWARRNQPRHE